MQLLEASGAVRPLYGSLGVKRVKAHSRYNCWRGEAVSIRDIFCVCVCSLVYPERKTHAP